MFDEGLGRSPLCLTVPGLGNSGPDHWQTIWERDRRDCERVPLGCWNNPSRNVWVGRIDQAVFDALAKDPEVRTISGRLEQRTSLRNSAGVPFSLKEWTPPLV